MKLSIAILLVSFFAMHANAAKSAGDCHKELKEMCKDKKGTDKFECMKGSIGKLDDECKKLITAGKEKFQAAAGEHPCKIDSEKCKDNGGGHAQVMKCLLERRGELSDSCKKHIDDKMTEMPCLEDQIKFCADQKPGEGRIYKCMKANTDKLSAKCKEKFSKFKKEDFDKED